MRQLRPLLRVKVALFARVAECAAETVAANPFRDSLNCTSMLMPISAGDLLPRLEMQMRGIGDYTIQIENLLTVDSSS